MARPDTITLRGKVGNLIFYIRKEKPCIRTMPINVIQGTATKRAARLFGKASAISKVIREELRDLLPDHREELMRLRLNKALIEWLRAKELKDKEPGTLERFEFNEACPLSSRLKIYPTVDWSADGNVNIQFSNLDLKNGITAPVGTTKVFIKLVLTGCNLDSLSPVTRQESLIKIDYSVTCNTSKWIEWNIAEENSLMIVVATMHYEVDGKLNRDLRWLPIGII